VWGLRDGCKHWASAFRREGVAKKN